MVVAAPVVPAAGLVDNAAVVAPAEAVVIEVVDGNVAVDDAALCVATGPVVA